MALQLPPPLSRFLQNGTARICPFSRLHLSYFSRLIVALFFFTSNIHLFCFPTLEILEFSSETLTNVCYTCWETLLINLLSIRFGSTKTFLF